MPRVVFMKLYDAIKNEPGFQQRVNANGRPQAHPLQKLVAAPRVLSYGESTDRPDENVRLADSTINATTKLLIEFLIRHFGPMYLRPPTADDLNRILQYNEERGLPGCIGSLDCSHLQWFECPKGTSGQYQNRAGKRSIVMETICNHNLLVWRVHAGSFGSSNVVNVLQHSPLFRKVVAGEWLPRDLPFTINAST